MTCHIPVYSKDRSLHSDHASIGKYITSGKLGYVVCTPEIDCIDPTALT